LTPRTLKLWEGKYSMRTMMLITILVLMTTMMAKAEETIDTKVKNFVVNEWTDIKEYQKLNGKLAKNKMLIIGNLLNHFLTR
jgi:protein-disulfide isomerase-like protein with CxxC motif